MLSLLLVELKVEILDGVHAHKVVVLVIILRIIWILGLPYLILDLPLSVPQGLSLLFLLKNRLKLLHNFDGLQDLVNFERE